MTALLRINSIFSKSWWSNILQWNSLHSQKNLKIWRLSWNSQISALWFRSLCSLRDPLYIKHTTYQPCPNILETGRWTPVVPSTPSLDNRQDYCAWGTLWMSDKTCQELLAKMCNVSQLLCSEVLEVNSKGARFLYTFAKCWPILTPKKDNHVDSTIVPHNYGWHIMPRWMKNKKLWRVLLQLFRSWNGRALVFVILIELFWFFPYAIEVMYS